ncbi:hypothetical protein BSKO_03341 [Bryopsis sp. KO-2023]|nr:hypothetical protein BSKO_03341 [Bryopsis sp. KO-2023]
MASSTSLLSFDSDFIQAAQLSNAPQPNQEQQAAATENRPVDSSATGKEASLTCNGCGLGPSDFESGDDWKPHFKSDWHRHNLRRKLKGRPPIGEAEFETLVEQDAEVSSISGSDSSDVETDLPVEMPTAGPQVPFTSKDLHFNVWRCFLVPDALGTAASPTDLLSGLMKASSFSKWAVILSKGGHFAAAVFERAPVRRGQPPFTVKNHKTLHRYVVRAKAGGRQSTKDASGKYAKSAGARLRRYNEAALERDIQDTLNSWKSEFESVDMVFYQAASADRNALFGGKHPPFDSHDERLRRIPFITRRPTFSEAKRVAGIVTSAFTIQPPSPTKPDPQQEKAPSPQQGGSLQPVEGRGSEIEEDSEASVKPKESVPESDKSDAVSLNEGVEHQEEESELHAASRAGDSNRVWDLLQAGQSPESLDGRRKTPYQVAPTKATRNVFRRFMAQQPDKWDYKIAGVPSPLTEEMAAEQHGKKSSKKARARARKREQKAAASAEGPAEGEEGKPDSDDEIARAVAEAAEEAARLSGARKSKKGGASAKKKVGGAPSTSPNPEEALRRRELLAAAAEQRLAALTKAANSQRLW